MFYLFSYNVIDYQQKVILAITFNKQMGTFLCCEINLKLAASYPYLASLHLPQVDAERSVLLKSV